MALSTEGTPDPVRVMACKSVHSFCAPLASRRRADAAALAELMPTLISGAAAMLSSATEDMLTVVVDALTAAVRVDADASRSLAPQVVPHVLAVWSNNANDPLLVYAVRDCIRAFASIPGCAPMIAQVVSIFDF